MGRFFKVATPQFVDDKMFKLPVDLMFQTIQQTDKNIDESLEKVDAFNGLLDIDNIQTDDPVVNEKLKAYKDRINGLSQNINKSPLDYKKYRTEISNLSKEIDNDMSRGVLGRAAEQKTSLTEELDRVNKLTGVSNERKSLVKDAIKNKYNANGGLDFKDENTYNKISDLFVNPLEDFDEEKFINTIGTNFEGDTTSKAWSNPDSKGYIRDGSKVITIRKEEDVEQYVKDSLSDGVWEAQKRQLYELRRDAGAADYTDEQIEQLVQQDKDAIINRAKNKLGFEKETRTANTKGDGTYMSKWNDAQRKLEAGNGVILQEVRDPRKAVGGTFNPNDEKVVKKLDGILIGQMGYDSHDDLYEQVFSGPNKSQNVKDFRKKLTDQGIPYDQFVTYFNYKNGVEKLETPHPDNYDPTNPDDIQTQQNLLSGVVTAINNRNPNERVKRIRTSTADGTYYETNFNSVGDMVSAGIDEGFIYLPATSTSSKKIWKTNPDGNLVDDSGAAIINSKTGKPVRNYNELIGTEQIKNVVVDVQQTSNITSEDTIFKADKGNTKQVKTKKINTLNQEKNEKDYVVTNQYLKVNSNTGKTELINVDVYIDSNDIGVKQ